ncbi:hypothetical protein LC612_43520, partial [Nostoc sp. CHAB 5834]|nr:hypothetical protein [Nostoc sp. CHAB 5834]
MFVLTKQSIRERPKPTERTTTIRNTSILVTVYSLILPDQQFHDRFGSFLRLFFIVLNIPQITLQFPVLPSTYSIAPICIGLLTNARHNFRTIDPRFTTKSGNPWSSNMQLIRLCSCLSNTQRTTNLYRPGIGIQNPC